MLSPVKAITAGALVFAIGGAMLIAQPFAPPDSAPGAVTDDPAMAPSFFSGTTDSWVDVAVPATQRRDDGVIDGTGESYRFSWIANDPRIAGAATLVMNETDYREGATSLVPTGEIGKIGTIRVRVDNDGGSWEGPLMMLQLENPEAISITGSLTGTDAYEGLSAYVVWSLGTTAPGRDLWGHITAEGPPPAPEGLSE